MKLSPIVALILSCVVALPSFAASVSISDFSGAVSNILATKSNNVETQLSASAVVTVAYYKNYELGTSDAVIRAGLNTETASAAAAFIAANFVPLGTGGVFGTPSPTNLPRIGDRQVNGVTESGRVQGQIATVTPTAGTANSVDAGGVPGGSRLFLIVWDGPVQTATALGVYSSDAASWRMTTSALGATILNTTAVDTTAEVYRGSLGSLVLGNFAPVPEPATFSVLALGAMVALRRKRR